MAEDEEEWLSARNKKKETPLTKIKKKHPKASKFKKSTSLRLTQNSPPPPELFTETKQSSIQAFFGGVQDLGLKKRDNSGETETIQPSDMLDDSEIKVMSLDGKQSTSGGNNSYMDNGLHDSRSEDMFSVDPETYDLHVSLTANRQLHTRKSDFITDVRDSDRRGRRRKRKSESAGLQDLQSESKKRLIDSEAAAKELEDFHHGDDDPQSLDSESEFSTTRRAGHFLSKVNLIDSEAAGVELQNFTVDTENLSQYICLAKS